MKKLLLLVLLSACGGSKKAAPDAGVVAGDVGPVTAPAAERIGGDVLFPVDDTRTLISSQGLVDLAVEAPGYAAALTTRGLRIGAVPPGSIAEQLGLASGDVIAQLDGAPVRRMSDLQDAWLHLRRDDVVTVTVERGATRADHRVFLAENILGYRGHDRSTNAVDPIDAALIAALKTGVRPGQIDPAVVAALGTPNLLRLDLSSFSVPGLQPSNASALMAIGVTPWDTIQQIGDRTISGTDGAPGVSEAIAAATGELAIKLVRVKDELTLTFQITSGLVDHALLDPAMKAWTDREANRDADRAAARAVSDAASDALDQHIRKIDDMHFEIDEAWIDQVVADPTQFKMGARITPSMKNGQPAGFKLYAVRPNSVFAKLGLANGDTIHAINGVEIRSLDDVPDLGALRSKGRKAHAMSLDVTRRGKEIRLEYAVK